MGLPFQTNANPNIYAQPAPYDPMQDEEMLRLLAQQSQNYGQGAIPRALPQATGQRQAADPTGMVTNATTAPPVPSGGLPRAMGRSPVQPSGDPAFGTDAFNLQTLGQIRKDMNSAYDALTPSEEDLAKGRGESMSAQLAGMALGAMGGEGLAPAGGAVLKQALAQQEKFGIDPYRDAKIRAERLQGNAAIGEKILSASGTKQSRDDALKQAQISHNIAQAGVDESRLSRQDVQTRQAEAQAQGRFDTLIAPLRKSLIMANNMNSLPTDRPLNAVEMDAVLTMILKTTDPDSAVMTGEHARIGQAQGLLQRLAQVPALVQRGERLNPDMVKNLRALGNLYEGATREQMKKFAHNQWDVASRQGLDPRNVISDPQYWKTADSGSSQPTRAVDFQKAGRRKTDNATTGNGNVEVGY